jgi:hypothetical protein
MRYFKSYISSNAGVSSDEIDISVHCDVFIFEWLVQYMEASNSTTNTSNSGSNDREKGGGRGMMKKEAVRMMPKIESSTAVSILISSEFLQMDALVTQSLQYIASHLADILALPVDLGKSLSLSHFCSYSSFLTLISLHLLILLLFFSILIFFFAFS